MHAENFVMTHFLMPCLNLGTLELISQPMDASVVAKWMIIKLRALRVLLCEHTLTVRKPPKKSCPTPRVF